MKEKVSFRSALNGFNREDVVGYIAGIMEKLSAAEKQTERLEQQALENERALNEFRLQADGWEKERAELTARCNELAALYETQETRACELERRLLEHEELSKHNEVKLGAAMLDAKRFSEMLIKEANDRAGDVYQNACECVKDSSACAEKIREQAQTLSEDFSKTMGAVLNRMNKLIDDMASFQKSAAGHGAGFLYESEFTEKGN